MIADIPEEFLTGYAAWMQPVGHTLGAVLMFAGCLRALLCKFGYPR